MTRPPVHRWAFAPHFRRHVFGWRSQPAVQRFREATAEIQKVAKKVPALAAAGAVLFLEKVSPALENFDSSSGAIGTAVNHAIETCTKIIADAPIDDETRDRWLDRLWEAHQNDDTLRHAVALGITDAEVVLRVSEAGCLLRRWGLAMPPGNESFLIQGTSCRLGRARVVR